MLQKKLFLSLYFLISSFVFSQDSLKQNNHYLGLNAGQMNGLGLSYRFNSNKFTSQVTTIGYKRTVKYRFNLGLSLLYNFHSNENSDFLIGVSGRWKHYKDEQFRHNESDFFLETIRANQINTGLNLDYFVSLSDHFRVNLSIGYGVYNLLAGVTELHLFNDFFNNLYSFSIGNEPFTSISGSIGIYYKL